MNKYAALKEIEAKIRLSRSYSDWVLRNKSSMCLKCSSTEGLECHHVVDLYHIISGLLKLYGDEKLVFEHACGMHDNDLCESVTLCNKCHNSQHPGRQPRKLSPIRSENWTVIPRNFAPVLAHATGDSRPNTLGLVAFQTLFGINWGILNGHLESRMLSFHRRRFAELLGKTPSKSFNNSLDAALPRLESLGVLIGYHVTGNEIELHIAPDWLAKLMANPWFVAMKDIRTSKMCVLALRWFIGFQNNRRTYKVGLDKLTGHLGILTTNTSVSSKAILSACEDLEWATLEIEKGMCCFGLRNRGSVPILSLRQLLMDSVEYGK